MITKTRKNGKVYFSVNIDKQYTPIAALNTRCVSSYEAAMAQLLKRLGIPFVHQYRNMGCRDKQCLPFDFYLPVQDVLVEVDGDQHRKFIPHIHRTYEKFLLQQKHDKIKDNFCKEQGIPLIRIPCSASWKVTEKMLTQKLYEIENTSCGLSHNL